MQAISSRQPAFRRLHLFARLVADDRLEVADHHRIGMRTRDGADAVEGIGNVGHPVAQRLVHRILERVRSRHDRTHFGAKRPHAQHVRLLPLDIDRAHIDHALQSELRAHRGGRNSVHAGAGLSDHPRLFHAARQQDLAEHIVHLVRAGVIKVLALEIDLRAARAALGGRDIAKVLGETFGEIERRWPAHVVGEMAVHFLPERWIVPRLGIGFFEIEDERHQRLGDEAAAIEAEVPPFVGPGPKRIGLLLDGHAPLATFLLPVCIAAWRAALDESADFVEVLLARRALDARGYVNGRRPRDPQCLRDIAGFKPARQHVRHAGAQIFQQPPVERTAEPAGPRGVARRTRIEEQPVGDLVVEPDRREIGALGNRQRLHHRQSKVRPHRRHALGRLLAVKLQQVGLERLDRRCKLFIAGVDRQRDLLRPAAHALAKGASGMGSDVTRRRRKEHETHHIGARLQRHVERLGGFQAADFDLNGHHRPLPAPGPFYIAASGLSCISRLLI